MTPTRRAILEVRGLSRRFGGLTALDKVDLSVLAGTIHAVIGPNGSGKTTLFNVIGGVYKPSAGEVRFSGRIVSGMAAERLARLGLVRTFQNTRLFTSLNVLENVLVAGHSASLSWRFDRAARRRGEEILEFVGIADLAGREAAKLPQGQRRLLELARALAQNPKLILLDEPHGGLNAAETERLIGVVQAIHSQGIGILLIEHEMAVVMRLAEVITVLNFGSVLCRGTPKEIQGDAAVVEAYLGRGGHARAIRETRPASNMRSPLLELGDLVVRFGDIEAVRGVSLAVSAGEIVGLLGSNGAGKSTTLKAIFRLLQPQSGDIRLDGRSLFSERTENLIRQGMALVPEQRRLFGGLSVVENLRIGAFGRAAADASEAIEEVLALFPNLRRLAGALAFSLSGGEQQMLAIGRALMGRPRLLVLDEPSLGLAPLLIEQVFAKLVEINRKGTAILLVEQNARMALAIADRAYILSSGRIVAEGAADALAADERVRLAYLGMGSRIDQSEEKENV